MISASIKSILRLLANVEWNVVIEKPYAADGEVNENSSYSSREGFLHVVPSVLEQRNLD